MNLDTGHVVQRFHHGLKARPKRHLFEIKIIEGSACMDRDL